MKTVNILGRTVGLQSVRGSVIDTSVSQKTHVTGGGSMYGRHGSMSISSHTTSETKLFLDTPHGERSIVIPGDYEIRRGHDLTVVLAELSGRSVPAGIQNHSLGQREWRPGSSVAVDLGIPMKHDRWAGVWRYLTWSIVGAWVVGVYSQEAGGAVLGLALATAGFFIWNWWREKRRTAAADEALRRYFQMQ